MAPYPESPFVWMGTVEEIRANLRDQEAGLGIERYTVRGSAIADVRRIVCDSL
ncbi:hypothetical protein BH23ACT2_BH23ACT2_06240 [soil metagenome]